MSRPMLADAFLNPPMFQPVVDQEVIAGQVAVPVPAAATFSVEASDRALPFHAGMHLGGSPGDDELYGGVGDDLIWGGRGDDRLDGGAGDDTLIGGPGADALIGGLGVDTADYSSATTRGVNISLGTGAAWPDRDGWPDDAVGDTFSSIENLVGTRFNDWLAADTGDNRIEGRRGNDWIFGGTDEDTLLGGEGHDYLFGGPGDDVLYGGVGADILSGDAGDDVLYGGDGPDHMDGGPGSDTVTYAGAAEGVKVSLGEATAEEDTIEAVEIVIGSDGDDTLGGDDAANLLAGMRGDDEIAGGGGDDTLWGGRGDDTLHGGPGLNRLTGGPGRDRLVFDETSGDAVITDFSGDRIDLTAFGFTRSGFERYVTIEEDGFVIDVDGVVIRVEVGVELGLADFIG